MAANAVLLVLGLALAGCSVRFDTYDVRISRAPPPDPVVEVVPVVPEPPARVVRRR